MKDLTPTKLNVLLIVAAFLCSAVFSSTAISQSPTLQSQIRAFKLSGSSVQLSNRTFQRDRVKMTLNGTLHFAEPIDGKVTGAVFIGNGTFVSETVPVEYERVYVNRLVKADNIESDFTTAVFRFSDDTFGVLGAGATTSTVPGPAAELATAIDAKMLKQTGANIPSRIAASIANSEPAGFLFAHFRGGKLNDFSFLLDPQTRIPAAHFGLNGGEKGVIFTYRESILNAEVLTAFYSVSDYQRGIVAYSDMSDVIDGLHHDIEVDLREPKKKLGVRMSLQLQPLAEGVRAIPFLIGESLGEYADARLKKQMRVRSAKLEGSDVEFVQEDWEGGFTVFLTQPLAMGKRVTLEVTAEGDFLQQPDGLGDLSYPLSNTAWYPRHGYLDRSTYSLKYIHPKRQKIGSVGRRISESAWPDEKDVNVTTYSMERPIALATFAVGSFERHAENMTFDGTDRTIPLEYNSVSGALMAVKEDFILAEISNSVRYFDKLFGNYPYSTYSATFHPYGFGQGFPSMLMIPPTDRANKYTYAFIAHETAHQWWGNIVAWRSYRDQWLSEGFAEYSGVLYTGLRENPKAAQSLIEDMRDSLRRPPRTTTGIGKGKLNEVGPIILGHRLNSSKTFGGYQTLIYNKGGLVLRMLHFLFTDPATANGDAFFTMMKDFVEKHRDGTASTDDFRKVANEHFARTPIARNYKINNLNWFFQQWVYETHLPKYTLEHAVEPQPDGSVLLTGHVIQEGGNDKFFMPLPIAINLGGNQVANGTVAAYGPKNAFRIKLPRKPQKVELDPNNWVLSESTSTK